MYFYCCRLSGRLLPAIIIGIAFHILIGISIRNESLDYVIKSSNSSWLQEHIFDLSEAYGYSFNDISKYIFKIFSSFSYSFSVSFIDRTCKNIPGLSKFLLPRANPLVIIGVFHFVIILGNYALLQVGASYLVDTYAAFIMAIVAISTMMPFTLYTGKILLQTTPSHLITQLDKSLREASTLDGVLEFRDEHFWTLSFGVLVGSLHVRIRRDADEQLVLAHVWNKLAGLVQVLTIHIFKDDWMRRTTHQLIHNQHNVNYQQMKPSPLAGSPIGPGPLAPNSLIYSQSPFAPIVSNNNSNINQIISNNINKTVATSRAHAQQGVTDTDYVIVN